MFRFLVVTLSLFVVLGCGRKDEVGINPEDGTTHLSRSVLKYSNHPGRALNRKKYFLVAGGRDAANFAEEIIEQKRFLMTKGVPEREIACFYSIPFDSTFRRDQAHYRA